MNASNAQPLGSEIETILSLQNTFSIKQMSCKWGAETTTVDYIKSKNIMYMKKYENPFLSICASRHLHNNVRFLFSAFTQHALQIKSYPLPFNQPNVMLLEQSHLIGHYLFNRLAYHSYKVINL